MLENQLEIWVAVVDRLRPDVGVALLAKVIDTVGIFVSQKLDEGDEI